MNSRLTEATAILAVAVMLFSAMTVATVGSSSSDAADTMPASYTVDSRYITPVRNQGSEGLCWAFGVTSTLESELILNGYYDNTAILSPLFTGVKQYDGYEKDYTGGDYNGLTKEGTMNVNGGTGVQLIEMLSNGKTPIEEYLAPYEEFRPDYDGTDTTLPSLVLVKGIECYNPYTESDDIKSMLLQNKTAIFFYNAGGTPGTMSMGEYKGERYMTVNVAANEGVMANHAVSLIGYDDDFPKEYFATKPKNDGAWLIKNSWGTNYGGYAGDCGYYWVSYESVVTQILFITEVEMNDGTQRIYSYDNGYSTNSNIYRTGEAVMANVFTAERDETITGASFSIIDTETNLYLSSLNQRYTVSVYELKDGYSNPYDGKCIYTSDEGLVTHCGTTYVGIKNGLDVSKGDKFSICVKFTGDSIVLPVDTNDNLSARYVYHVGSGPGQSYTYSSGKWMDISADGMSNFRIKAYTSSDSGDVASVNGITYGTIQDAIDNAESGDTVYLLKTSEVSNAVEITGKDITLDLRGYHLTCTSGSAVKITDSDATVQYGRIIAPVCIETDNSNVDISRCYLQPSDVCVKADNGSDVDLCRDRIDTSGNDTGVSADGSAVKFTDCYQTAVNTAYVIVSTSNGGSAVFNGGTYYGIVNGDDIKAVSGTFMNFVPAVSEGSLYDAVRMQVCVPTIEYVDAVSGDTLRTASLAVASTSSSGAKLIADVNTTESISTEVGSTFTLDLNGYDLTTSGNLIANACSVSIINGQSDGSSLTCRSMGTLECGITVGENVDIRMTSDVATAYTGAYSLNISIAEGSSMAYRNDTGSSVEVYEPYSSDGKLYVKVTADHYDANGEVTATENEIRTYLYINIMMAKYTYTAEKTYADGTAEKTIGEILLYSGSPICYTKTVYKGDKVLYTDSQYDMVTGAVQTVEAVKGGRCDITLSITASMNTAEIEAENVRTAIRLLNEKKDSDVIKDLGCSEINLYTAITTYSTNEKVITAEISKLLIDGGVGISVAAISIVSVSAATIAEIGERTVSVYLSEIASDDVTDEQESTLAGFRVIKNLNIKVDGSEYSAKLDNPVELTLNIPNTSADSKVYRVNEDGSLTQLGFEYLLLDGMGYLKFSAPSAGVYAVDVAPTSDDHKDDPTVAVTAAAVAAIVVILALLVLILRRGQ